MTARVINIRQQGSRLSWRDALFEKVEPAQAEQPEFLDTVPMLPEPDVTELMGWPPLDGEVQA